MYSGAISYHRLDEVPLGEGERGNGLTPQSTPNPRCFNCGSTGHLLSSCPDPRNRPLIDLSRQLFAFLANDTHQNLGRIHEVEGWKSRRLEWSRIYRPGEVTGSLLRDALGLRDAHGAPNMPWLENISRWGYPPGWISCEDPVERVRRRILDGNGSGDNGLSDTFCQFTVLNDTAEDSETLQLDSLPIFVPPVPPSDTGAPHRWAMYPNTHFLSELLPAYTGRILPLLGEPDEPDGRCRTFPPLPPDSPPPLPPSFPHGDSFDEEADMDLSD